ncbi:hypothetical protein EAO73_14605, partial [Streptomyces sp. col6]|uniref:hypothetical protein n=1 Tax=Streptomyces sp. col6 TaxID=2478958 RepID=UPI0011CD96D1
ARCRRLERRDLELTPPPGRLDPVQDEQIETGAFLIAPYSAYPGGRASYAPAPGAANGPFVWESDIP